VTTDYERSWVVVTSNGQEVERAMGIEPTRPALPGLGNKRFGATTDAKSD